MELVDGILSLCVSISGYLSSDQLEEELSRQLNTQYRWERTHSVAHHASISESWGSGTDVILALDSIRERVSRRWNDSDNA